MFKTTGQDAKFLKKEEFSSNNDVQDSNLHTLFQTPIFCPKTQFYSLFTFSAVYLHYQLFVDI